MKEAKGTGAWVGAERKMLMGLVPIVQKVIDGSAEAGHPYPSNKKIANILKDNFGFSLSRNQVSKIRKEITSDSNGAKP